MKHLMINEALPIAELHRLGLYDGHKHLLTDQDLSALLSGRRTSMVKLQNLLGEAFVIESLDAKLSLHTDEDNFQEIKLHPIYKEPQLVPELFPEETGLLISGERYNIEKSLRSPEGKEQTVIFEYDNETKEFISYDPSKLKAPFKINGEILNEKLQKDFAFGSIVELSEGTNVRYSVKEPKGIIANRSALIISSMEHGSLLIERISPLPESGLQLSPFTPGFASAFIDMEKAGEQNADDRLFQKALEGLKIEYGKGYSHGLSR